MGSNRCVELRDVDMDDSEDEPEVHSVTRRNDAVYLAKLVTSGVDLDVKNQSDEPLLHTATRYGALQCIEVLLKTGVDIDTAGPTGQTALHLAAHYGRTDAAELLVRKGAALNLEDNQRRTPVMVASEMGHYELVTYFRHAKAVLERPNLSGPSAIHFAVLGNRPQMVEHLLAGGYSKEKRDAHGLTPLALAARFGLVSVARKLIDLGASRHPIDLEGNMPLHLAAARGGNHRMVELLLDRGANVNSKNRDGDTALHLACRRDDYRTVKALKKNGAEWKIRNKFGETPLLIVDKLGHDSMIRNKVFRGK